MSIYTNYLQRRLATMRKRSQMAATLRAGQANNALTTQVLSDAARGVMGMGGVNQATQASALGTLQQNQMQASNKLFSDIYASEAQRQEQLAGQSEQVAAQMAMNEDAEKKKAEQERKAKQDTLLKAGIMGAGAVLAPFTGGASLGIANIGAGFVGQPNYDQIIQGMGESIQGFNSVATLGEHKHFGKQFGQFILTPQYTSADSSMLETLKNALESGNPDMIYKIMNTISGSENYGNQSWWKNFKGGM